MNKLTTVLTLSSYAYMHRSMCDSITDIVGCQIRDYILYGEREPEFKWPTIGIQITVALKRKVNEAT